MPITVEGMFESGGKRLRLYLIVLFCYLQLHLDYLAFVDNDFVSILDFSGLEEMGSNMDRYKV